MAVKFVKFLKLRVLMKHGIKMAQSIPCTTYHNTLKRRWSLKLSRRWKMNWKTIALFHSCTNITVWNHKRTNLSTRNFLPEKSIQVPNTVLYCHLKTDSCSSPRKESMFSTRDEIECFNKWRNLRRSIKSRWVLPTGESVPLFSPPFFDQITKSSELSFIRCYSCPFSCWKLSIYTWEGIPSHSNLATNLQQKCRHCVSWQRVLQRIGKVPVAASLKLSIREICAQAFCRKKTILHALQKFKAFLCSSENLSFIRFSQQIMKRK